MEHLLKRFALGANVQFALIFSPAQDGNAACVTAVTQQSPVNERMPGRIGCLHKQAWFVA